MEIKELENKIEKLQSECILMDLKLKNYELKESINALNIVINDLEKEKIDLKTVINDIEKKNLELNKRFVSSGTLFTSAKTITSGTITSGTITYNM